MLDNIQLNQVAKFALFTAVIVTLAFVVVNLSGSGEIKKEAAGLKGERKMMKTGGLGQAREKDDEVSEAVKQIQPEFEAKTDAKYESIEIISYKPQVVAGMNYFVKALTKTVDGVEKMYHLRIYRDLQKNFELTAFQADKTKEEEVVWFQ